MKCPGCNKFAALEVQEPETDDLDIDATGHVTCSARLVRSSECCGEEMKEATFDLETDVDIDGHEGDAHELSVEETSVDILEEGGGRYAKSYFGVRVGFRVRCSCDNFDAKGDMSDKVAASGMDELN